jgi:hypothetical protein
MSSAGSSIKKALPAILSSKEASPEQSQHDSSADGGDNHEAPHEPLRAVAAELAREFSLEPITTTAVSQGDQ